MSYQNKPVIGYTRIWVPKQAFVKYSTTGVPSLSTLPPPLAVCFFLLRSLCAVPTPQSEHLEKAIITLKNKYKVIGNYYHRLIITFFFLPIQVAAWEVISIYLCSICHGLKLFCLMSIYIWTNNLLITYHHKVRSPI